MINISDQSPNTGSPKLGQIVVIGAGISGLVVTSLLLSKGYDVICLEASTSIGGRIKSIEGKAPFALEMGAEFLHGNRTEVYRMANDQRISIVKPGVSLYNINDKLYSIDQLENDEHFENYLEFYEGHHLYKGDEVSVEQYLNSFDIPSSYKSLYETWAAELGTDLSKLGMKSAAKASWQWDVGDENYRVRVPYLDIFQTLISEVLPLVQFRRVVRTIERSEKSIRIVCENEAVYHAESCVCTIPLSQLKKNVIQFVPPLSEDKSKAISKVGMDPSGIKCHIEFSEPIFSDKVQEIVGCKTSHEFWVASHGRSKDTFWITAFIMGEKAKNLSFLGEETALQLWLKELSSLCNKDVKALYLRHIFQDWGKEPYIQGAYSYSSPESRIYRRYLSEPEPYGLFFAGEACNCDGHHATVHGAMETAVDAFKQVCHYLEQKTQPK